jgi:hypothetical protein
MQVKRKQLTGYLIACYGNNRLPSIHELQRFRDVAVAAETHHSTEPDLTVDTDDLTDLWRFTEAYLPRHFDMTLSPDTLVACAVSEFMASRGWRYE